MARFVLLEEDARDWTALGTLDDLEAYEYYVAGTVGCLLQELICHPAGHLGTEDRRRTAGPSPISFGLGLQGHEHHPGSRGRSRARLVVPS